MSILILENIRSLHNVGSFFRTADGAGVSKIYLSGYTGTPPDRRIEKVSLGAEDFVEWEHVVDPLLVCANLKQKGYEIIAVEQTARSEDMFLMHCEYNRTVFIFGNEVEGVSDDLLSIADRHLEIPMFGKKSSLNVSVAGGIVLYAMREESLQKRGK